MVIADITRWLLVYELGGAYVDTDVRPGGGAKTIDMCSFDTNGTGILIGKEADLTPQDKEKGLWKDMLSVQVRAFHVLETARACAR